MPGLDPSIYSNINKPADPLSTVGGVVGLQNAFTNQQLLQTQLQREQMGLSAQQGQGDAFQGAVGSDGNFDAPTYNRLAAGNGARFLGAANAANSANAAAAGTGATVASTGLSQSQQNWAASNIMPLFNDPRNPPKWKDVGDVILNGIHSGALDNGTGNALYGQVLANSRNPKALQSWAQNKFIGSMGTAQAQPGATVTGPAGATQLSAGQTAAAAQGGPGGASATPPSATGPGVVTSAPTGVQESYKEATDRKNADYASSQQILGNARNLELASDKLDTLDPSDATSIGQVKNTVLSTVSAALGLPAPTGTMNYQEAEKYLEKSKANLPAAQRSDMAQHLADVSNPNLSTSLAATKALSRSALGFARMDAAMPFAYDAEHPNQVKGQTDPAYMQYPAKYINQNDPDGFIFERLGPTEQRQMITEKQQASAAIFKGLPPEQIAARQKAGTDPYSKFRNSVGTYDKSLGAGAPK